jgi:hypothetical protein
MQDLELCPFHVNFRLLNEDFPIVPGQIGPIDIRNAGMTFGCPRRFE